MIAVAVLSACMSCAAAVLAFLAWRAAVTRALTANPTPELRERLEDVQERILTLGTAIRDEQERLRAGQTAELAHVRSELRQVLDAQQRSLLTSLGELGATLSDHQHRVQTSVRESGASMAAAQGTALESLRVSQSKDLATVRSEVRTAMQDAHSALVTAVDGMRGGVEEHLRQSADSARVGAAALSETVTAARREQGNALQALQQAQSDELKAMRGEVQDGLHRTHEALVAALGSLRASVEEQVRLSADSARLGATQVVESVASARQEQTAALNSAQRRQDERLSALTTVISEEQHRARREVRDAIGQMSQSNEARLEEMRATVQEKLDATLTRRLDASFKQVSERLEVVHRGLGEMQALAQDVDSLQRTLTTSVKARGTWGELQLEALLEDLLTPEQYQRQYRLTPSSNEAVDFAVRLPGQRDDEPVWLPLDSKCPMGAYEKLVAAWEGRDPEAIKAATKKLVDQVVADAASISRKYVQPPHTTDFAVMYLPTEALFAEVVRQPGLLHLLRTKHRIVVAGPTTVTALLGSLSLGFRTLAIQQRSSEVWQVLALVKQEFDKSGTVWEKVVRQLDTARNSATEAGRRHRAIERQLRVVEQAPLDTSLPSALAVEDTVDEPEEQLLPRVVPRQSRRGAREAQQELFL